MRKRSRRVTWFNPPYSKNVATRIGQKFLKLMDQHFPAGSKLHKIFNKGTVKVSYIIKRHNAHVCKKEQEEDDRTRHCNCQRPDQCPLNGKCLTNNIVYEASVSMNNNFVPVIYIRATETPFKQRYVNHLMSLRHDRYENSTELSK